MTEMTSYEIERLENENERLQLQWTSMKDEVAACHKRIAQLLAGLQRLSEQNYDAGYSAEDYALAVFDGHEP
jgi:septal ring factor EnvC (AmiA/AmiB activator)